MTDQHPITPPPEHLLKKFSAQAQDETKKRNGAGYLKTFATLCIEWAMNSQSTSNDRQIRSSEITPPPELFKQWEDDILNERDNVDHVLDCAWRNGFQAGADQELEACCEQMQSIPSPLGVLFGKMASNALRAARRPKPPSLKEQALAVVKNSAVCDHLSPEHEDILRRALEALDD